VAFNDDLAAE
jgi:hypothetical protein